MVPNKEFNLPTASSTNVLITNGSSTMPIYHGSIIAIEQRTNDPNGTDLIIRVPNFPRLSSMNTPSKPMDLETARVKRRAPICPILVHSSTTGDDTRMSHRTPSTGTRRLTLGLRSLSRAFTRGCRSKRTTSSAEMAHVSSLPDIEVINNRLSSVKPQVLVVNHRSPPQVPSSSIVKSTSFIRPSSQLHSVNQSVESKARTTSTSIDLLSEGSFSMQKNDPK
jgi:hypothetical protein